MTLLAPRAAEADAGPACYSRFVNEWVCADYLRDRGDQLRDATVEHLAITGAALVLAVVLAFPLALLARRSPRVEAAVLGISTSLYAVPSLALLPLLVPFTGLTATTVVIGLALYSLTILVRAVLDGLRAVPAETREAAVGLGYAPTRLLLRVELPLSLPVMLAGLRVAAVSTVALTTVGTVVSWGGLGDLVSQGVSTDFRAQLLAAAVLCVVIALLLDALIVAAQRVLTPWTRGVRK